MILKAIIDDQIYTLNVPDVILHRAGEFFDGLDRDMDRGWQMSRDWVQHLTDLQRCQVVADKLLTAMETENDKLGMLMAGYILHKLPAVDSVEIDIRGEIQNTEFSFREPQADPGGRTSVRAHDDTSGLDQTDAREQAERDVTRVFKVSKGYRFSVLDPVSGEWRDSPAFAAEDQAEQQRQKAVAARFEAIRRPAF